MKLSFSILLPLVLLFITPAYSADLSSEKEEELRSILTSVIDAFGDQDGNSDDIEITKNDAYFSAVIPNITLNSNGETFTKIGQTAINASPINDDEWNLSFTLPPVISTYDATGRLAIVISLKEQTSSAIYNNKSKQFSQIKATYDQVKIDAPTVGKTINVEKVSIIKDWKNDGKGFVSGPFIYTLTNLNAGNPTANNFFAKEIVIKADIKNYNINNNSNTLENSLGMDTRADILENLMRNYVSNSDKISLSVDMNDITLTSQSYSSPAQETKIANTSVEVSLNDLRKKKSYINLNINHNSDPTPSLTSYISTFIPYKVDIDLSFKNLLKDDILTMLLEPELKDRNDDNNTLRVRVYKNLIPTLTSSSSSVDINSFIIDAYNYGVDFKGKVEASEGAEYNATASLNATMRGLDIITNMLSGTSGLPSLYAKQLNKITQTVSILRLVGKQRGDEDIRDYDVELDKMGTIILNGTDISAFTGNQGYTPVPNAESDPQSTLPY